MLMPFESSPKEKRVLTNDHSGLIGKKGHCTKAEVAAVNAAKEAKVTTAAATKERVLTKLAEIEIEIEKKKTEAIRHKAVIHKHSLQKPLSLQVHQGRTVSKLI